MWIAMGIENLTLHIQLLVYIIDIIDYLNCHSQISISLTRQFFTMVHVYINSSNLRIKFPSRFSLSPPTSLPFLTTIFGKGPKIQIFSILKETMLLY
jgi:hypothetical protein